MAADRTPAPHRDAWGPRAALAACDTHTYVGYAFRIALIERAWFARLDHLAAVDRQAERAVRRLLSG